MELELKPITLQGVDPTKPMIIAGPCSAETEEQVMCTAKDLANKGIKIFRAGIWKPRTNRVALRVLVLKDCNGCNR